MAFNISFDKEERFSSEFQQAEFVQDSWKKFLQTINSDDIGFFHVNLRKELLSSCMEVYEKFQSRSHFIQVGIGGSSLGPEMLISALQTSKRNFTFINNVDPDYIHQQLNQIEPKKALFYFVSKSGGTAETNACLAIICEWLRGHGIEEKDYKNYFVFATDPVKSDFLELSEKWGAHCLEVPTNVGGRFSVLTPVGLFPALFAGISAQELLQGAQDYKKTILDTNLQDNILLKSAQYLLSLEKIGFNQTVLMPYSSKLRDLSFWFVQLWAESLGKKTKEGNVGLTPVPAYGATDQHSQVQLFMEGPYDKVMMLLEVENPEHDFSLKNTFETKALKGLSNFNLSQLMTALLNGTLKALEEQDRPTIHMKIEKLDAYHLGQLILFYESLTALVGLMLDINPFDQPGVEAGKRYAFQWLEKAQR